MGLPDKFSQNYGHDQNVKERPDDNSTKRAVKWTFADHVTLIVRFTRNAFYIDWSWRIGYIPIRYTVASYYTWFREDCYITEIKANQVCAPNISLFTLKTPWHNHHVLVLRLTSLSQFLPFGTFFVFRINGTPISWCDLRRHGAAWYWMVWSHKCCCQQQLMSFTATKLTCSKHSIRRNNTIVFFINTVSITLSETFHLCFYN